MATCNASTLLEANPFTELDPGLMEAVKLQLLCDISASGGGGGGGGVPTTRTISTTSPLQGGGDLSANRTLSILQASGAQNGFLSSGDWTTFNGKIGGSGTSGTFTKFSAAGTVTDSSVLTESAGVMTASGPLEFSATTHGGIRLNNLTTTQRNAIAAPTAGSLIWNTTTGRANIYTGSSWMDGFVRLAGDTMTGALDFSGTTHAGIRLNNLTTAQRDAIASPAAGMFIWNTTTGRVNTHNGTVWMDGFVRLAGDTMTGALGITQGAITADAAALNITSTYNNNAVTFGGAIKLNVTDTASNAASLIADLQVGGISQFAFSKSGILQMTQGTNGFITFGTGSSRLDIGSSAASSLNLRINGNGRNTWGSFPSGVPSIANGFGWNTGYINLHNSTGSTTIGGFLTSEAANSISLVNSTNGQTIWVYNTYTSSTNHERLALRWNSGVATIETQKGSGGGTAQVLIFGTDSTERLRLDTNGNVVVNTAAIATNATNGFLYVPSCAGTPTGTPTTFTGRVPIVVDTTNNKLYFYSSAAWRDAGP